MRDLAQSYAPSAREAPPVPPSLLPHSTSKLQRALLGSQRRPRPRTPPATTSGGSHLCPSETSRDGTGPVEELSWSRHRVVWSRGGAVYRTFNYDEDNQQVVQALFVDLQVSGAEQSDAATFDPVASTSAVTLDSLQGPSDPFSSSFGPYRQRNPTAWSDDPLPLPTDPPKGDKSPETTSERHLVVILSATLIFAYPASGGAIPIHFPFRIRRAWSLDEGMLVEGAESTRTGPADHGAANGGDSSGLYTLMSPFDEFKPVCARSSGDDSGPLDRSERPPSLGNLRHTLASDGQVIFCSAGRDGAPAILVTAGGPEKELKIWSYSRLPKTVDEGTIPPVADNAAPFSPQNQSSHLSAFETAPSPRDLSRQDIGAASSPMSRGPSSLSGTKRKHGVSFADADVSLSRGERSVRRASGQGLVGAGVGESARRPRTSLSRGPLQPEEEMLDALTHNAEPPPTLPSARGNPFSTRRAQTTDRRTSLTRNELSVTMDRMALSQSGVPFALGPDLAHEATILLGEDPRAASPTGSDLVLTRIWTAKTGEVSTSDGAAYLFDIRQSTSTLAIHLPIAATLLLLKLAVSATGLAPATMLREVPATSAAVVSSSRAPVQDLLIRKPDGSLALLTADGLEEGPPPLSAGCADGSAASLRSDGHSSVNVGDNGSMSRLPRRSEEARDLCLEVLAQVLPLDAFTRLRTDMAACDSSDEALQALASLLIGGTGGDTQPVDVRSSSSARLPGLPASDKGLRSLLRPGPAAARRRTGRAQPSPPGASRARVFETALFALHLLVQRLQLETAQRGNARAVSQLVLRLVTAAGFSAWIDYYARKYSLRASLSAATAAGRPEILPQTPPDLLDHLAALLRGCVPRPFPTLLGIARLAGTTPCWYYGESSTPTRLVTEVLDLYEILTSATGPSATSRARRAVLTMAAEYGWDTTTLEKLSAHVYLPLKEAVRSCQLDPPEDWPAEAYALTGRSDLARQKGSCVGAQGAIGLQGSPEHGSLTRLAKLQSAGSEKEDSHGRPSGNAVTRFNEDRRLEEVARMLRFDTPCIINAAGERSLEQLTPAIQQSILTALSQRTMALPVGAGMFRYCLEPDLPDSDQILIAEINTSARILPMSSPVALAEKEPRDPTAAPVPDRLEWPEFHAGVAAALEASFTGGTLDSSRISFNRPATLDARHAGLLFGLGLRGHLDTMLSSQAYDYLKAKHDPTSIGILLGLAVSYLGTGDATVTSVISIHLPALHPPQSALLNVSGMTQAAAAAALGFVHFASGHRSFSDVLLAELCSMKVSSIEDGTLCREAYALSAGFGFGMIMLGRGRNGPAIASGEAERLRVFRCLIHGESNHSLPGSHHTGSAVDINITSPAATIAVTLMYLRSERKDIADLLAIPDSVSGLDYVRPDLLLLRVMARSLVWWSTVQPSKSWVEAQIPAYLAGSGPNGASASPELEVARWHVIAGACFAIGLRFAGTASADGHATLIHYLDRLTRASYAKAGSVPGRIRRHALRNCLAAVTLGLAMVMAGTGEVNVLRRLRVAHGIFGEGVTYGSHLASHMALGLLFLGSGKYTLGTSDAAIAALLLSLYPAFPATSVENRAHLQAYRHLWILAVEPRYLEARDVDSGEQVFLPVRLHLKDGLGEDGAGATRAKQLVAPTLLPDLHTVERIQTDSPRYLPSTVQLASPSQERARFLRSGVMWVKRRTGHLTYAEDPRGIRSIFTRSKSEAGSSVFDFGETSSLLASSAGGLRGFVAAFSSEAEALAATEMLCHVRDEGDRLPTRFEAFASTVLLECLTKDKFDVAAVYHAVYRATKQLERHDRGGDQPTAAAGLASSGLDPLELNPDELDFIAHFYRSGHFKRWFGRVAATTSSRSASSSSKSTSSTTREALLSPALVAHVATIADGVGARATDRAIESGALAAYLQAASASASPGPAVEMDADLALAIRRLRLPDWPALCALRATVSMRTGPEGEEQRQPRPVVEMLLRRMSVAVAEQSGRGEAWTAEAARIMAEEWCSAD